MAKYRVLSPRYHGGVLHSIGTVIEYDKKLKKCPDTLEFLKNGEESLIQEQLDKISEKAEANIAAAVKATSGVTAAPDFSGSKVETL